MNKDLLLWWILEDAEKNEHLYQSQALAPHQTQAGHRQAQYEQMLEELGYIGGERGDLPASLPSSAGNMVSYLRRHFKDDVTLISRVLNYYFPERYLFYRVSDLEDEIFSALEFFSSTVPEFRFPFRRVGRYGFDRYLQLNDALLEFFHREYPGLKNFQARIAWFLYEGLGHLFLGSEDHSRYWILVTREDNFESLDTEDSLNWSARKEMRQGDVVFMYRASPRSAITDVFRVKEPLTFNPWSGWRGFWVDMERICAVEDIPFSTLKNDSVLGEWGIVRKRLQGVVTEPVPPAMYNKLLEKLPAGTRSTCELEPQPTAVERRSGAFVSEAEFQELVIEPVLRSWELDYEKEFRVRFRLGSQEYLGRVDFYVRDHQGPLTLFENKLRIVNDRELEVAAEQGKSYALMLGLPSFVVGAPEGLWVYSLDRNEKALEKHISTDELETKGAEIRRLLLSLRAY